MQQNQALERVNEFHVDKQLKADITMLVVTIIWGSSYLFMKMGLESFQTFNLIALRLS